MTLLAKAASKTRRCLDCNALQSRISYAINKFSAAERQTFYEQTHEETQPASLPHSLS